MYKRQLRKLKDAKGNYIWQPSVSVGVSDMILNRPYYTSTFAPEVAAGATPLAFGDFSYYWIADREGIDIHHLWANAKERHDKIISLLERVGPVSYTHLGIAARWQPGQLCHPVCGGLPRHHDGAVRHEQYAADAG